MDLILKEQMENVNHVTVGFSPRNGEVILKGNVAENSQRMAGFSPRNGEIVLKGKENKR